MSSLSLKRILCAAALVFPLLTTAGCGEIYSREDFSQAVMSKSEPEVEKRLGKPFEIDAANPQRVIWTYKNETFDVQKQNARDAKTLVIFEKLPDGALRVTGVEFG